MIRKQRKSLSAAPDLPSNLTDTLRTVITHVPRAEGACTPLTRQKPEIAIKHSEKEIKRTNEI